MDDTAQTESLTPNTHPDPIIAEKLALIESGKELLQQKDLIRQANREEHRLCLAASSALENMGKTLELTLREAVARGEKPGPTQIEKLKQLRCELDLVDAHIEQLDNPAVAGEQQEALATETIADDPLVTWLNPKTAYASWDGKMDSRQDERLRNRGFTSSCPLPREIQEEWKSPAYPSELTPEAVRHWREKINRFAAQHEYTNWESFAETYRAELASDVELLRRLDPSLVDEEEAKLHATVGYGEDRIPNELSLTIRNSHESNTICDLHTDSRAKDTKTDNSPGNLQAIPQNPEVVKLIKLVLRGREARRDDIDVARQFTDSDERKAKNLLRQARRFPHLLPPRNASTDRPCQR